MTGRTAGSDSILVSYLQAITLIQRGVRNNVSHQPHTAMTSKIMLGVMDIILKTSFPDIRKVAVIHSLKGTVMSVPLEDRLVRFYIQIDAVNPDAVSGLARRDLKIDDLLDAARAIMFPYTIEAAKCAWWSAYRVGQRVANEFARHNRIFLAGDSVREFRQEVTSYQ